MKDCALLCWDTRTRTRKGRTRICSVTITPYPNILCNRVIAWLRVQRYGKIPKSPNIFPTFFSFTLIFSRFMTKHLYLFLLIYHFYGFVAHIVILFEYVALDITHHLRLWLYSFAVVTIDRGQWDTAYSRAESPKAHSPGQRPGFLDVIAINALQGQKRYTLQPLRFCPCRAFLLPRHANPGCRFALPWAMCSMPFQGVHPDRTGRYFLQ